VVEDYIAVTFSIIGAVVSSVVVVVVLSVVEVVLSVVEVELSEAVNSSFSSLHEMMLRLINEMEITYIVFLIELS